VGAVTARILHALPTLAVITLIAMGAMLMLAADRQREAHCIARYGELPPC
jgi:hypothetical protein